MKELFCCPACEAIVNITTEDLHDGFCVNCKECKEGIILRKQGRVFSFKVIPHEKYIAPYPQEKNDPST